MEIEKYIFGYQVRTRGSFPGEADHPPPSSAEIKNAWNYTSTPPYLLNGMVAQIQDTSSWCSTQAQGQLYLLSYLCLIN
jgi:hypothetical protein